MKTKFRTLWLLGFIGLVAPAAGCIASHHDRGGSQSCLDSQYYEIQWGVDHGPGTLPLSCTDVQNMRSSVVVYTNAAPPYDYLPVEYYIRCNDRWTCPDGTPCNMDGTTASGLHAGTEIVRADLLAYNGAVLSSAVINPSETFRYAIDSCNYTIGPFPFTIP